MASHYPYSWIHYNVIYSFLLKTFFSDPSSPNVIHLIRLTSFINSLEYSSVTKEAKPPFRTSHQSSVELFLWMCSQNTFIKEELNVWWQKSIWQWHSFFTLDSLMLWLSDLIKPLGFSPKLGDTLYNYLWCCESGDHGVPYAFSNDNIWLEGMKPRKQDISWL